MLPHFVPSLVIITVADLESVEFEFASELFVWVGEFGVACLLWVSNCFDGMAFLYELVTAHFCCICIWHVRLFSGGKAFETRTLKEGLHHVVASFH